MTAFVNHSELIYKCGHSKGRICKSFELIYKCGLTLQPHL